jgi:AraC-like DNA-binding protein
MEVSWLNWPKSSQLSGWRLWLDVLSFAQMSDVGSMKLSIPTAALPGGIPTYTGRHGKYVWPAGHGPQLLLFHDFDLLWVRSGRATLDVAGGVRLAAREGEMFLLPPLVAGTINQAAGHLVFWYCHFDFRASPAQTQAAVAVPLKLSGPRASAIAAAYAALNSIGENSDRRAWQRESALIQLVCALAASGKGRASRHAEQPSVSSLRDPRVVIVRNRIEAEPGRPWRVGELAAGVDLSRGHLHALWAAAMGSSLKGYVVRARLHKAMSLLRDPSPGQRPSVKQVAAASGFSSQHLFCRQFRQAFGVTPTAFRNSAGL